MDNPISINKNLKMINLDDFIDDIQKGVYQKDKTGEIKLKKAPKVLGKRLAYKRTVYINDDGHVTQGTVAFAYESKKVAERTDEHSVFVLTDALWFDYYWEYEEIIALFGLYYGDYLGLPSNDIFVNVVSKAYHSRFNTCPEMSRTSFCEIHKFDDKGPILLLFCIPNKQYESTLWVCTVDSDENEKQTSDESQNEHCH